MGQAPAAIEVPYLCRSQSRHRGHHPCTWLPACFEPGHNTLELFSTLGLLQSTPSQCSRESAQNGPDEIRKLRHITGFSEEAERLTDASKEHFTRMRAEHSRA
eukprot:1072012-Amphidinium_carterae.1